MNAIFRALRVSLPLVLLAATAMASPAAAQSDSSLRRENSALRGRVGDLEAELNAAQQRIRELEQTIKDLEAQIRELRRSGDSSTPPPVEKEKVTVDESVADASPRALLRALQKDYKEKLSDMETGSAGDRARDMYLRAVRKWAADVNRAHRGQVTWTIELIDAQPPSSRGVVLQATAVDPVTGVQLGDQFPVLVTSRTLLRRLETLEREGNLFGEPFQVKAVLRPEVDVNPNREAEGTFNNPPFIGPFAEFRMGLEVLSMRPASEVQQDDDTPDGK